MLPPNHHHLAAYRCRDDLCRRRGDPRGPGPATAPGGPTRHHLRGVRPAGMMTVLVIEDELSIAEMVRTMLEDEGYRVLLAANGREGLAQLATERPDLVLSD